MKHEYFAGIDFDNLPTYAQVISELNPYEKVYGEVCQYLIENYGNASKEKIEDREKLYKTDIVPYLQQWAHKVPEEVKEETEKLAEVMGIQTEIMINMHDDLNIGFTELYKKARNIEDPVIVKQLNE